MTVRKPIPFRPLSPDETAEQRAERVENLRQAWLAGTLDLTVPVDGDGVDRLLEDLFTDERRRKPRR